MMKVSSISLSLLLALLSSSNKSVVDADGIFDNVTCTQTTITQVFANTTISNNVCTPGTVQIDNWLANAVKTQDDVAKNISICDKTFVGTHNSAISMAYGFGTWDDFLTTNMLKVLSNPAIENLLAGALRRRLLDSMSVNSNQTVVTANQAFSFTDQMNMGVRFIEIDLHVVNGKLVQAHCGGITASTLSAVQDLVTKYGSMLSVIGALSSPEAGDVIQNYVLKLMLEPQFASDPSLIGCLPGLCGLTADQEPPAANAFTEIQAYLAKPENADKILHLYIDTDPIPSTISAIYQLIQTTFPGKVFTPADFHTTFNSDWSKVTTTALLALGRNVFFTSSRDVASLDSETANFWFTRDQSQSPNGVPFCGGWTEVDLTSVSNGYPSCSIANGAGQTIPSNTKFQQKNLVRAYSSDIHYSIFDESFAKSTTQRPSLDILLPEAMTCANLVTWDYISPTNAANAVWSWAAKEPAAVNGPTGKVCASMSVSDQGRWRAVSCSDNTLPVACKNTATNTWTVATSCPSGTTVATPVTSYDNQALYTALQATQYQKVMLGLTVNPLSTAAITTSPATTTTTTAPPRNTSSANRNSMTLVVVTIVLLAGALL